MNTPPLPYCISYFNPNLNSNITPNHNINSRINPKKKKNLSINNPSYNSTYNNDLVKENDHRRSPSPLSKYRPGLKFPSFGDEGENDDEDFNFDIDALKVVDFLYESNDDEEVTNESININNNNDNNKRRKYNEIRRIDNLKICRHGLGMICHVSYVRNLINNNNNNNKKKLMQKRAGIIPYIVNNEGQRIYALGVDTRFGSLTDFGGGVKKGKETVIEAALREFKEETLGVFKNVSNKSIKNDVAIYNDNILIIFVKVNVDPDYLNLMFLSNSIRTKTPLEVNNIAWIPEDKFIIIANKFHEFGIDRSFEKPHDHINDPYIYSRIQPLIWASIMTCDLLSYLH